MESTLIPAPDELAQKIEKINAKIEVHIQNGDSKLKRTNKNTIPAPGSWSER